MESNYQLLHKKASCLRPEKSRFLGRRGHGALSRVLNTVTQSTVFKVRKHTKIRLLLHGTSLFSTC